MGRQGMTTALLGMLAAGSVYAQDTTSTTTTAETTVIATTLTTDITTVIDQTSTTIPFTTVVSTTVTVPETTAETTVITTSVPTSVTTVIDSTTTVIGSTTETVTTVTVTPSSTLTSTTSSSTTTSSSSSTTTNAPQYTGATFHIESANGDVGEAAPLSGATRKDLIFDVRSEFTLDGFGRLVSKADGYVAQTNAGSNTIYQDVAPATSRSKRQAVGTALTCSVATTGVLACTGTSGSVFYTDGTNLYLGTAVPAGFTPITLIAVIDAAVTSGTSSTVAPTGPLPTVGPTTPVYAGWGQWSYPQPTGVPVALTTVIVYPGPGGLTTQTVTVTSLHCGCTETPLPTTVAMTTYVTECPESWGYTAPVTVVVPVKPTGAVWGSSPSASAGSSYDNSGWITYGSNGASTGPSVSKPAGNSTLYGGNKPYTGAASGVGASAGLLTVSIAMLAFLL